MRVPILAVASLLLPAALTAQTDRITIRLSPAPNQTVRQLLTMRVDMDMQTDTTGTSLPTIAPQHVEAVTTVETTSTVAAADGQGRYDARVVCDAITATVSMNGKPMPDLMAPGQAVGQAFLLHFDERGVLINSDVDGPPSSAVGAVKRLLTGLLANAEPISLSIGESATVPRAMNLPMPASGPAGGMTMSGETRYTLTSITFDGADRIAHLAVAITVKAGTTVSPAAASMTTDTRTTGNGVVDVNIDRGIVLHQEVRMTMETSMHSDGASSRIPSMQGHGTTTMSSDLIK